MVKPDLKAIDDKGEIEPQDDEDTAATAAAKSLADSEELDADEAEFRAIRTDLPGSKGLSAIGIVSINVGKTPGKNEFFRTHATFRPAVPMVDLEVGMDRHYFAVTADMVPALAGIGITVTTHTLYMTVTPAGAVKIIPVRHAMGEMEQNEYARTKEIGLINGITEWVRLYTDLENRVYKVFPAPAGRFADPIWPELKEAKIFRLGFRDKGRLLDTVEHALFQKWAARDR
jgi:hypothetical protein